MTSDQDLTLFNPAGLPEWRVWEDALAPGRNAYGMVGEPSRLVALRPALEAAFAPAFRALIQVHGDAQQRMAAAHGLPGAGAVPDPDPNAPDPMDLLFAIREPLDKFVTDALQAGMLRPMVEVLVAGTVPDLPPDGQDVWARINGKGTVNTLLQAALAEGPYYQLKHDVTSTLEWLANDPGNALLWTGCLREAQTRRARMSVATNDDQLPYTLGDLVVATARRMERLPALTTLAHRIADLKGWTKDPARWSYAGYTARSALARSFTRWTSPQNDPLFDVLPRLFWSGVRNEVQADSRLGAWIDTNLMHEVLANPDGPQAQDYVLRAWSHLNKPAIRALEQTLPGASLQHLPALLTDKSRMAAHKLPSKLSEALGVRRGSWARAAFRRAGAPVEADDLAFQGAFQTWVQERPAELIRVLMGLNARLEAEQLRTTMAQTETTLDAPLPKARPSKRL